MSVLAQRYGFNQLAQLPGGVTQFAATQPLAGLRTWEVAEANRGLMALTSRLVENLTCDGWRVEKVTAAVRPGAKKGTQQFVVYVTAKYEGQRHSCGSPLLKNGIDGKRDLCVRCGMPGR